MRTHSRWVGVAVVAALLSGCVSRRACAPDAARRTTSLAIVPDAAGDGRPQIVARMTSTDGTDGSVRVDLQWFDDGQPPKSACETTTPRAAPSQPLFAEAVIDAAEFPSTHIVAVFEARADDGTVTFRATRTVTVP